jgi:hypothetical protein
MAALSYAQYRVFYSHVKTGGVSPSLTQENIIYCQEWRNGYVHEARAMTGASFYFVEFSARVSRKVISEIASRRDYQVSFLLYEGC